jgi:hypothetical protein
VAHTTYNAIMAVTDALMNANPISLVVLAIAALTAAFVLAYEKIKPFHDAVDTAFILPKGFWSWLTRILATSAALVSRA